MQSPVGGGGAELGFDILCVTVQFAVKLLSPKSQSNENGVLGEIWRSEILLLGLANIQDKVLLQKSLYSEG